MVMAEFGYGGSPRRQMASNVKSACDADLENEVRVQRSRNFNWHDSVSLSPTNWWASCCNLNCVVCRCRWPVLLWNACTELQLLRWSLWSKQWMQLSTVSTVGCWNEECSSEVIYESVHIFADDRVVDLGFPAWWVSRKCFNSCNSY